MKYLLCLLFLFFSTLTYGNIKQSGDAINVSAPKSPWELRFPKGGWELKQEQVGQGGRFYDCSFSDSKKMMKVSIHIEPAEKCHTAQDCRAWYMSNPWPADLYPQSVEQFEENGIAIVKYLVPIVGGFRINQLNYSAHIVRDGYWVNLNISKQPSQKEDAALFSDFLRTIAFEGRREEKRYPVADHGYVQVRVISSWKGELREHPQRLSPSVVFQPEEGGLFQIWLTPVWSPKKDTSPLETIREEVRKSAEGIKSQTVEQNFPILELQGTSGQGFYLSATDKAPQPGDYKFLTQGILLVGELKITFDILTNDSLGEVVKEALAMLKGAVQVR
jgi:hypothetical protein